MRICHSMIRKNHVKGHQPQYWICQGGNQTMGRSMTLLMESKQPEEVGQGRVGGCSGLEPPGGGCKVISFAQDGALVNIKTLCHTIQVKQAAR